MPDEPVVSAWLDDCPLSFCEEGRAIFMVHADREVTLRCPDCHQTALLNEDQDWFLQD